MAEVADVVAVIRAEDGDFKRKMKNADQEVQDGSRGVEQGEARKQKSLIATARALTGVRAGWLGIGAAVAGVSALMARSPIHQALSAQRDLALAGLGNQLYRGLGLDDAERDLNRTIRRVRSGLKEARGRDPTGQGNLISGELAEGMRASASAQQQGRAEAAGRRAVEDQRKGFNAFMLPINVAADLGIGLANAALGRQEAAARRWARAGGVLFGTGGVGPGDTTATIPFDQPPPLRGPSGRETLDLGFGRSSNSARGGREEVVRLIVEAPRDTAFKDLVENHVRKKLARDLGGGFG